MRNYAESRNAFRFSWVDFNGREQEKDSSSARLKKKRSRSSPRKNEQS